VHGETFRPGDVIDRRREINRTGDIMGIFDKLRGRSKKAVGDLAGDESLVAEGAREEGAAEAKEDLGAAQSQVEEKAQEVAELEGDKPPS